MKKPIENLCIWVFVTLLFLGCSTTMDREGYGTWPYQPIIKDDENTLYIPILSYDGYMSEVHFSGDLARTTLYKLESNSLIKTTHVLNNFAHSSAMDEQMFDLADDGTFISYIKGINVDNEFHHIVIKISDDEDYNNQEYLVMENDSIEKTKLAEYITTYYEGRINFKEILAEVRLKMPPESNDYDLRISLYPEGLYIIYPSRETVDYKSKTTKVSIIDGSSDLKGYYVSYYRYYPVSNPINFTEVRLPFLIDIENM